MTRALRRMRKYLVGVACIALIAGVAIGGTIAWLTATSGEVTNTFTNGNITITLDEAKVDANNDEITGNDAERVTKQTYTFIPGEEIDKDPIVHVAKGSEKCWVYVYVENNLIINDEEVATWVVNDGWQLIGKGDNKYVYAYNTEIDATAATTDYVDVPEVFSHVTISGEKVTSDNIETLKDKTIVVKAYAHQSDYVTDKSTANTAALQYYNVPAVSTNP